MMREWESTRGVTGLIERIKKYQKTVILVAPPTSREESEAIKEFEKNGIWFTPPLKEQSGFLLT